MGRPKLTEKKERVMAIRVSDEEYEQITKAAKADSRRLSNFIRIAILKYINCKEK